jgi:fructose-1,6-bisphosphatase II
MALRVSGRETGLPFELRGSLGLGLVRATELAAMAAARHLGRGDQDRAREAAATAMLEALEELDLRGRVVLGPRGGTVLSYGSMVGSGESIDLDLAVQPLEGASLVADGLPNAISLLAAAEPGGFPSLPAVSYADRIVAGPEVRGAVGLDDPVADNLRRIAFARDCRVADLTVAILNRPRHQELVEQVRRTGARLALIEDGDVAGALAAAAEGTGVDVMVGVGGLQQAMLAACAVRCLAGEIQARLWPRNDEERILAGGEASQPYGADELAPRELVMAVTGISGGIMLPAVVFRGATSETSSLLLSSRHATIRRIATRHLDVPDFE